MNQTLTLPEFDPELQPIGYTLALEFLGDGTMGADADSPGRRFLATFIPVCDRFGWEFDTAA